MNKKDFKETLDRVVKLEQIDEHDFAVEVQNDSGWNDPFEWKMEALRLQVPGSTVMDTRAFVMWAYEHYMKTDKQAVSK